MLTDNKTYSAVDAPFDNAWNFWQEKLDSISLNEHDFPGDSMLKSASVSIKSFSQSQFHLNFSPVNHMNLFELFVERENSDAEII